MSRYEFVLFDADDTLLDFKRSEHEAVCDVMHSFGLPVSDDIVEKYSRINDMHWKMLEKGEIEKKRLYYSRWEKFCEFYGYSCDPAKVAKKYEECLSNKSYLMEGALDLCQKLYGKCKMYLVTNGNKRVQEGRFNPSALHTYFEDIFISEDIGYEKPRAEFFDRVFSRIPGFIHERTIIVGDSLTSDIAGGINAGIDTCWYNPKSKPTPENMEITYIKNNLSEIEDVVLWGK